MQLIMKFSIPDPNGKWRDFDVVYDSPDADNEYMVRNDHGLEVIRSLSFDLSMFICETEAYLGYEPEESVARTE